MGRAAEELLGMSGFRGIRSFLQRCATDKLPMIQNREGLSSVIFSQHFCANLSQQKANLGT